MSKKEIRTEDCPDPFCAYCITENKRVGTWHCSKNDAEQDKINHLNQSPDNERHEVKVLRESEM